MDKKTINEEQFRKLVIIEAKKFLSEEKKISISEEKGKITFDKVESLIKEMEQIPKSIKLISLDVMDSNVIEGYNGPNRDLDVIEHNKRKNIFHSNEEEKDKWNRMLNYKIPSDEQR